MPKLTLQMWMNSASRDTESKNVFETILKNLEHFLKDKNVAEAEKEMACSVLEGHNFY